MTSACGEMSSACGGMSGYLERGYGGKKEEKIRSVSLEFKNITEDVFHTTRRAVRKISVLYKEDELELVEELNEAAEAATRDLHFNQALAYQNIAVNREVERVILALHH